MAKDLYALLGVSRDASPEDIKKAYRAKSKELHPDKHKGDKGVEDKFKEINEAYEILSNPQRKQAYDQFGSTGNNAGGGGPGFGGFDFNGFGSGAQGADFGDIFGSFFGGAGGGRGAQRVRPEGADREIQLTIDLMDSVKGGEKTIRLQKIIVCGTCDGKGADGESKIISCSNCGGTGQTVRTVNSFFGQIQQRAVCNVCEGSGKVPEKPCRTCGGAGRVSGSADVVIDIPPGIDNGQTLRVRGQGDAGLRGAPSGELYVHMRVRPDPRFEREGDDIRSKVTVPVIDALLGGEVEVETVQGESTVQVPEGMQPGQVFRIRGKGMPQLGSSRHGDHYVTINVEIPKKLSKSERKILEQWKEAQK
jgi:molecular chaperone DnaJ